MKDSEERYRVVDSGRAGQWNITEAAVIGGEADWSIEHTIITGCGTKKLAETVVHRLHEAYRDGALKSSLTADFAEAWCRACSRVAGTMDGSLMAHKRYVDVAYQRGSLMLVKCEGSGRPGENVPEKREETA